MKGITYLLTIIILMILFPIKLYAADVYSNQDISIIVNGTKINPNMNLVIKDNKLMAPIKVLLENLGAEVDWNQLNEEIIIKSKDKEIKLKFANKIAYINGKTVSMEFEPFISEGNTMIPVRFIATSLGFKVGWIQEAKAATITHPQYYSSLYDKKISLGYVTNDYQGDEYGYNSLVNTNKINTIATYSKTFDFDGNLNQIGVPQDKIVSYANSKNIKPLLLVTNLDDNKLSPDLAHYVLSNETRRRKLEENILILIAREGYSGVNVDIENMHWYDRENYTNFIKELKNELTFHGFLTTVSIAAKTFDTYKNDNWGGAFDYASIGEHSDFVTLMTYDEHYLNGPAGPIASLPWVKDVLNFATKHIPSKKILLGIAGYGYDWSDGGNSAIAYNNIYNIGQRNDAKFMWNEKSATPYLTYTKNVIEHEVWYENGKSIGIKLQLVNKYRLGGFALWKLGNEDEMFLKQINI